MIQRPIYLIIQNLSGSIDVRLKEVYCNKLTALGIIEIKNTQTHTCISFMVRDWVMGPNPGFI